MYIPSLKKNHTYNLLNAKIVGEGGVFKYKNNETIATLNILLNISIDALYDAHIFFVKNYNVRRHKLRDFIVSLFVLKLDLKKKRFLRFMGKKGKKNIGSTSVPCEAVSRSGRNRRFSATITHLSLRCATINRFATMIKMLTEHS